MLLMLARLECRYSLSLLPLCSGNSAAQPHGHHHSYLGGSRIRVFSAVKSPVKKVNSYAPAQIREYWGDHGPAYQRMKQSSKENDQTAFSANFGYLHSKVGSRISRHAGRFSVLCKTRLDCDSGKRFVAYKT